MLGWVRSKLVPVLAMDFAARVMARTGACSPRTQPSMQGLLCNSQSQPLLAATYCLGSSPFYCTMHLELNHARFIAFLRWPLCSVANCCPLAAAGVSQTGACTRGSLGTAS